MASRLFMASFFGVALLGIAVYWWTEQQSTTVDVALSQKEHQEWLNQESRRVYAALYQEPDMSKVADQLRTGTIWASYSHIWDDGCCVSQSDSVLLGSDGESSAFTRDLIALTMRFRRLLGGHTERYVTLQQGKRNIDFVYHSEAIEGGTLRWDQVASILAKSTLQSSASVRDVESALNHATALAHIPRLR